MLHALTPNITPATLSNPCHRARSPDDARDTFKTLRNSAIGAASAQLYSDWAGLEYAAGSVSRALGILAKGFKEGAQPTRCVCVGGG